MSATLVLAVASASAALYFSGGHEGQIVHVANNGMDSAECGSVTLPCRSIKRGIDNAAAGDTILVGPGLYGDLNRDQDFDDPGEEMQDFATFTCLICVGKSVRIISSHGANATRIESSSVGTLEEPILDLVSVQADGVTFGEPGHGFLLFSVARRALVVGAVRDVSIGGNVTQQALPERPRDFEEALPQRGIFISGAGGRVRVIGNETIDHHFGIAVTGSTNVLLARNVALNNSWEGIVVETSGRARVFGNYASGNGSALREPSISPGGGPNPLPLFPVAGAGFLVAAPNVELEDNISIGNFGPGFWIDRPAPGAGVRRFSHNASIGNIGAGFHISNDAGDGPMHIRKNNIFGNLGAESGCGLINESGKRVDARNNFWGAATGPGEDPADEAGAGSGCDRGEGSQTDVTPFAPEPLPIVPKLGGWP